MMDRATYAETIRGLSDRLVRCQRPIRILDAIKWTPAVEQEFFAHGERELPPVDLAYYQARPLAFDAAEKIAELRQLERDTQRALGTISPVGSILARMCREYATAVRMLAARGTAEFCALSRELYGSAYDAFHAGDPTLADLGTMMSEALGRISESQAIGDEEKTIDGAAAVEILERRLAAAFANSDAEVRVVLDDGIVADAAAGADTIKIRREARFSDRDLRMLEIHEGWVHLGTTLNGKRQPVCTFLSKGPPSSTTTQEGLAILMEVLSFASHPSRLRRLTGRIQAVRMAEDGADFLEVYRYFGQQGLDQREAYRHATRVFRGSTPTGGPFSKDLSYSKGFVQVYNYLQLAVRRGLLRRIPLLFCGKVTLRDLRILDELVEEGLVTRPSFLPPQFADLQALSAWMCYSNFLNRLSLDRIEADYADIL